MDEFNNICKYDILVVEDDRDLRRILSFNLKASGFNVREAENGKVALEKIKEKRPDCIILDVMMPVMDGLETCKRIKSVDRTKDIPIVFLSAKGETEDKIKGMKFDADDYMVKPFDFKELLARIYLHISKKNTKRCDVERERERSSKEMVVMMSEAMAAPVRELREKLIQLMEGVEGHPELEHLVKECEEQRRRINDVIIEYQKKVNPYIELCEEETEVEV